MMYHEMILEEKLDCFQDQLELDLRAESEVNHPTDCHCINCKPALEICSENLDQKLQDCEDEKPQTKLVNPLKFLVTEDQIFDDEVVMSLEDGDSPELEE